jgi:segregation and condensation protein A
MKLLVGNGMNNFIIEWNDNREADIEAEGVSDEALHESSSPEE